MSKDIILIVGGSRGIGFAAAKLPVGRIGESEDSAQAIFACIENGFMTGAIIDVDGGAHLGG